MGATFPNGIASFKTHNDFTDPVEAADVNKIQDELVAVEEALGAALNEITIIEDEVSVLTSEQTTDAGIDASLVRKYESLKDLLSDLWDGQNIYAATASGSNIKVRNTPASRPYPPDLLQLSNPGTSNDPMGMWNGTGFTLKKSGFWVAHGVVNFGLAATGPGSNDNFGTYEASITQNGTEWIRGLDRRYPVVDSYWHNVVLQPTLMGWFTKGTHLTLRAAQSSNLNQNVASAHLGLYRVRG